MGMSQDQRDARPTPHHGTHDVSAGQTELFPTFAESKKQVRDTPKPHTARPLDPTVNPEAAEDLAPVLTTENDAIHRPHADRPHMLQVLLDASTPVKAGSKAAAWLKTHRIFKKTWESQDLRVVENYRRTSDALLAAFPLDALQVEGLFNKDGHLRFYKHSLLVPWLDAGHAAYLQAFAPEGHAVPPDLTVAGPIPCPYNARLLDGASGRLYLCAGALDTMELLEAGFPAVGLPRLPSTRREHAHEGDDVRTDTLLKTSWLARFRNKSVYVAFDGDADGEAAATTVIAKLGALQTLGVETHRLAVPAGKRVGDWVAGR